MTSVELAAAISAQADAITALDARITSLPPSVMTQAEVDAAGAAVQANTAKINALAPKP